MKSLAFDDVVQGSIPNRGGKWIRVFRLCFEGGKEKSVKRKNGRKMVDNVLEKK